jgi:ribosomal RNA-processing protein 1
MSDKPLVQQALASELADLLVTINSAESSLSFLSGFWETIVREWNGIDRLRCVCRMSLSTSSQSLSILRIDKYYMLVRRFVNASFRMLMRAKWKQEYCEEYNRILTHSGGPLWLALFSYHFFSASAYERSSPNDTRVPVSLGYHLADIYIEELDKMLKPRVEEEEQGSVAPAPLMMLLSPFLGLAACTTSKHTYDRIVSAVLDPLLEAFSTRSDEPPSQKRRRLSGNNYHALVQFSCLTNAEGILDKEALRKALLRSVFDVASEQETRDSNRRRLYAFWREHMEDEDEHSSDKSVDK